MTNPIETKTLEEKLYNGKSLEELVKIHKTARRIPMEGGAAWNTEIGIEAVAEACTRPATEREEALANLCQKLVDALGHAKSGLGQLADRPVHWYILQCESALAAAKEEVGK